MIKFLKNVLVTLSIVAFLIVTWYVVGTVVMSSIYQLHKV